jgi:hypothetical protein
MRNMQTAPWRSPVRHFAATMMILAMATPAYAQANNLLDEGTKRPKTEVEVQQERDRENGYKSGINKMQDQKGKVDPWGNVRGAATPQPNQKQQRSGSK